MAKGIEDTAFYRWHRQVGLNEVGGDPDLLDEASPDLMHRWALHQQQSWPMGMTALSTHDTKRSEDVRARLGAVAGDAESWQRCAEEFAAAATERDVDLPTAHLVWQTLVGIGDVTEERLRGYLTKAMRESKERTSWLDPDPEYEARVLDLAVDALGPGRLAALVRTAVDHNAEAVRATVLGQKLLQLTLPGVPDTYQGTELVDLSLVDPDNRRPVDFDDRRAASRAPARGEAPRDLHDEKLLVTHKALTLRRELRESFGDSGDYQPIVGTLPPPGRVRARRRGGRAGHPRAQAARGRGRLGRRHVRAARGAVARRADRSAARRRREQLRRRALRLSGRAAAPGAQEMSAALWAPRAASVDLVTPGDRHPLTRGEDGWWRGGPDLGDGDRYSFSIDGGDPRPDPRGLRLPDGPHGASAFFDVSALTWTDDDWRGVELAGSVIYEAHVGTFTPEGTLDAAVERLPYLVDLGVDVVELLPLATFPGRHNWGYDGVAPYSVHEGYGGPAALHRFVDAAHALGLGVCLDVVYNHLGPDGNYLHEIGPYFDDAYVTPWGQAVNLDGPDSLEVRRWVLDNVAQWLRDFHVDGLRLDAVHELHDESALHLLEEMSREVDALAERTGRTLWLVAESDRNDPRTVTPRGDGAPWAASACTASGPTTCTTPCTSP